jgi:hypothetical protein
MTAYIVDVFLVRFFENFILKYFRANYFCIKAFIDFGRLFLILSRSEDRVEILNKLLKHLERLVLLYTLV